MTYTEAAVEVLRRSGKPLHFKEIATLAVEGGLLSHVGQTPEATMGSRLLAMARREADHRVVTVDAVVFELAEWGVAPAATPEAPTGLETSAEEPAYRQRERHPPLREETIVGGRRDERRRRADGDEGARHRRYPPPAEAAYPWLLQRGEPATLQEIAAALRAQDQIAEALERDFESLGKALQEENRRRRDSGRPPLFGVDEDGRVRALEPPPPETREAPPRAEKAETRPEKERREPPRPVSVPGVDEQRRSVLRAVRRRLSGLDAAALERVATALLEAQGYRELNLARRSGKEGPLYLARHRWGAGELRYAVRVLRPGRDIGRPEVQEIRRDLAHYSAQLGIVVGAGECSREARGESNLASLAPVLLYGNEALAEAMVDAGLGVARRTVEWLEFDDAFFLTVGAPEALPADAGDFEAQPAPQEDDVAAETPAAEAAPAPKAETERRPRDRRRERRGARTAATAESAESAKTSEPAADTDDDLPAPEIRPEAAGAVEAEAAAASPDGPAAPAAATEPGDSTAGAVHGDSE